MEGFPVVGTGRYAIPSGCDVVRVGKIDVWGVLVVVVASMAIAVGRVVDLVIVG